MGRLTEALQVIDSIHEYPGVLRAQAANHAFDINYNLCRQLVVQSLAEEICPQVIRPLVLVEPTALQEVALMLELNPDR